MSDIKIDSIQDVKNILDGTHEYQNKLQFGMAEYAPTVTRKVGDRWVDSDGITWEQKEGYVARVESEWRKELREQLTSFPNCRKESCTCNQPKRLDEKMRTIHGMCFDCVVEMEHKLRIEGTWEEYEKERMKQNALAWLKEAERDKNFIAEELSKAEFVNSFGDVEKWDTGTTKEELLHKIEEEFEKFRQDFIAKLDENVPENIGDGIESNENDA